MRLNNYLLKKEKDGSITLFLALVLLVVISLLCTIAESTRVYLAMVHSKSQAYRAIETEFAGYARQLFEDYGVIALYEGESVDEKIRGNIELENISEDGQTNLILSQLESIDRTGSRYLTDYGGEAFVNQVLEYEKYEATEETINLLISRYQKYKDNEEDTLTGEEQVEDYENADDDASGDYIYRISEVAEEDLKYPEESVNDADEKMNFYNTVKEDLKGAVRACDNYIASRDEIEKKYGKSTTDLSEDENKAVLNNILLQIEIIEAKYNELVEVPYQNDEEESELEIKRQRFLAEIAEYEDEILSYQSMLVVVEDVGKSEEDKKNEGIFDVAKKMIEEGPIGLVIPSDMDISKNTIKTDKLPSTVCEDKTDNERLKELWNRAWFVSYVNNNFGNALSPKKDTALKYEMEYIISGKDNDKSNLESVVGEMVLIRQVANNITLITDSVKMESLSLMAASISCSICMPYLEPLIKLILIEAWALAESIADLRTLLAGGEVSFIKTHSQWKTSLDNLLAEVVIDKKEDSKDKLLKQDYNMYLLILLLTKGTQDLAYRTMDLVQLNICKRYNSEFDMSKCLTSLEYKCKFFVSPVFANLPFIPGRDENGGYSVTIKTGYSY